MVKENQKEKVQGQRSKVRPFLIFALFLFPFAFPSRSAAQQAQTTTAPIYAANAKYVQGVGPGYWPTAGSGLSLTIAAGTAYCGTPPALVTYGGGALTLAPSATNYVYLNPAANCVPASNTTGFSAGHIPLAKVVTGAATITTITDARTWFAPQPITTDAAGGAQGSLKKLNGIRFADQFPGANASAKLNAALADIGTGPGVVVALPGLGPGAPSSFPNDVALLDFRQVYDFLFGAYDGDPDRTALVLLENHLGEMTTRPATGTVTLTNGSTAVTGSSTQFLTQFDGYYGRSIKLDSDPSNAWAQVLSVTDNTHMTLDVPYPGSGGTGSASYFRTELGFVVDSLVTGGTPNTGSGGESVGIVARSWREGGTRGLWGANFNVGYYTRDPKAPAVGLEVDLSNESSTDANPGATIEEAVRIISAGTKRAGVGIGMHKVSTGGEFIHGIWMNNSYSSHGIHINGPSNHIYLIPNADDPSPMLVGMNAANSSAKWMVGNDGTASFQTLTAAAPSGSGLVIFGASGDGRHVVRSGPPVASFSSESQGLMNNALNVFGVLNPTRLTSLQGVSESNTAADIIGTQGVGVATHTGSKVYVAGVEGDAYHETAGTLTSLIGVAGYAQMSGTSGTVGDMMALYAHPNVKTAGTVNNNYGLYVAAQTAGTNNYSIYTAGTAPAQFGGPVISGLNVVTFSATPTFDARLGNTQKITLTGNVTSSTLSNAMTGQQINFLICQDATGSRTFAWPSIVKGGMTIGSTASKCTAQTFIFDGTNAYALSTGVTNM